MRVNIRLSVIEWPETLFYMNAHVSVCCINFANTLVTTTLKGTNMSVLFLKLVSLPLRAKNPLRHSIVLT